MADAATTSGPADDIRPVVETSAGNRWVPLAIGAGVLVLGAGVFSLLASTREDASMPQTVVPQDAGGGRIAAPTPLALPDAFESAPVRVLRPVPRSLAPVPAASVRTIPPPAPAPAPPRQATPPPGDLPSVLPDPIRPSGPSVLYDRGFADRSAPAPAPSEAAGSANSQDRVTASRFANPARTVPKGTVIPAVLETALDSTRPGAARALVQRDIRGFDGSRVLIPRGSRIYGEYEASLQPGQKRALIRWTRLMRPDGVMVALDSPASDPLGRAGVRGKVDSKFFARFGNAILQSVLDVGVGVAVREASDGVIVALPGSTQNVVPQNQQQVQPTLKVRHGTSVSVFVARDLDFSTTDL